MWGGLESALIFGISSTIGNSWFTFRTYFIPSDRPRSLSPLLMTYLLVPSPSRAMRSSLRAMSGIFRFRSVTRSFWSSAGIVASPKSSMTTSVSVRFLKIIAIR